MTAQDMYFEDEHSFQKFLNNSAVKVPPILFVFDPGGALFILRPGKRWHVIDREPGRADVYYERDFATFNEAAHDMLKHLGVRI